MAEVRFVRIAATTGFPPASRSAIRTVGPPERPIGAVRQADRSVVVNARLR
jgi:hypothetical protein